MSSRDGRDDRASGTMPGRLELTRQRRQQLLEAAREFRKQPTRSEALLWQALRGGGLNGHRFRRQHQIGAFVVDFCCPAVKLVLEIDGAVHQNQMSQDQERQDLIESHGYQFLRVGAADVEADLAGVLDRVSQALSALEDGFPPRPFTGEGARG